MHHTLASYYRLDNFNDTFALGHYARVIDALDKRSGASVAFKVLRPEHLAPSSDGGLRWEVRAFGNEADLLLKLADNPYVVRLHDCGYVSAAGEVPIGGEVVSFGLDVTAYQNALNEYAAQGWRPYLALENLPRTENLLYAMRSNAGNQLRRLPVEEGLALALQFSEFLRAAHQQGIVYLDHKLEHVYWNGSRLRIIDLNSSRQHPRTSPETKAAFRLDLHNLCVGVLYPALTGFSPVKGTLRPQPGNRQAVESRYQDVTELDFGATTTLAPALVALLQAGAAGEHMSASAFINQLQEVAALYGWDFPDQYTSPANRAARAQLKAGLSQLREGEAHLREARDLLRDAAVHDHISSELELELRRIVKAINEALNHRVIP